MVTPRNVESTVKIPDESHDYIEEERLINE